MFIPTSDGEPTLVSKGVLFLRNRLVSCDFSLSSFETEIAFKDGETCIWPGRASDGHSNTIKIP